MEIINKTNLIKITEHFAKTNYVSKPKIKLVDVSKLKYNPQQLTCDVLKKTRPASYEAILTKEVLQELINSGKTRYQILDELGVARATLIKYLEKFGLYKPIKVKSYSSNIKIDIRRLQELVNENKTLNEMAAEFNVSPGKIRYYLHKHGIKNVNLEELSVLRNFLFAKTSREKAEAYAVVDKYLEQIAKEKYQLDSGISFDDYLQDLRLKFLELAEKRKKRSPEGSRNLFKELREMEPIEQIKLDKVDLSQAVDKVGEKDALIKNFEDADFMDYIIENSGLTDREKYIVEAFLKKNKTFINIAEILGLTSTRVGILLKKALEKMEEYRSLVSSEQYIKQRAENAYKYNQQYKNAYWGIPVKNSNNYVWKA